MMSVRTFRIRSRSSVVFVCVRCSSTVSGARNFTFISVSLSTLKMFCGWLFFLICALSTYVVFADIDYALECDPGYRISAIRRTKTYYNVLGSLTIECEQIARPDYTTCAKQPSIPKCNGQLEGCHGDTWLGGFHAYLLENSTQAIVLDPVCCSSPHVRIDPTSCINDQINIATLDFAHSLVADLTYRGLQCWHQYNTNRTLVDLLWKTEICPFQSVDFPIITTDPLCEECSCACGVEQCATGVEPVRIIHKKRIQSRCGCDCRCSYKCIKFD
ncbi:unnamed protein product [Cylicocyclus nassatus]|uniref:Uncharacterized protein n=1 Tax=Cylicocyclus nassatus TaxID=53992 RepID=A0AA36HCL9_CYLNA|nr:unnamed protein product [Cylicocyclus nassatus]